jgi:hypothetical protein
MLCTSIFYCGKYRTKLADSSVGNCSFVYVSCKTSNFKLDYKIENKISFQNENCVMITKITIFTKDKNNYTEQITIPVYLLHMSELLGFWTFPLSGILETRKHDVSEISSVPVLR